MRWFTIKISPGVKAQMSGPAPKSLIASAWIIAGAWACIIATLGAIGLLILRPSLPDAVASRFHRSARAVTFDKVLTLTVPPLWQVSASNYGTSIDYYEFDIRSLSANRVSWLHVEAVVEPRASIERKDLYGTGQWQTMAVGGVAARCCVRPSRAPGRVIVDVVVEDKNTFIDFMGREEHWTMWRAALENATWKPEEK